MTIVQSYHCRDCGYGFGPIGVRPYVPTRPQVFRYCRQCKQGQALVREPGTELACVHCHSTDLVDVQGKCPVCSSPNVGWS